MQNLLNLFSCFRRGCLIFSEHIDGLMCLIQRGDFTFKENLAGICPLEFIHFLLCGILDGVLWRDQWYAKTSQRTHLFFGHLRIVFYHLCHLFAFVLREIYTRWGSYGLNIISTSIGNGVGAVLIHCTAGILLLLRCRWLQIQVLIIYNTLIFICFSSTTSSLFTVSNLLQLDLSSLLELL